MALRGRPLAGMLVYLLTYYVHPLGSWWGSDLPNLRYSLLASLVTLLAIKIKESESISGAGPGTDTLVAKPGFFSLPEHTLYLLFVLWLWFQSLWVLDLEEQIYYAVMATKFLLLLYLIHKSLDSERSIIIFLVANLAGCAYFGWIGLTQHKGGRFESVSNPALGDGNMLSMHMMPILLFSCFILLCDLTRKKYLLVIPIALTLNGIFLTQSRGSIVGIVAGSILAFMFRPYRLRKQIYFYVLLAVIAGVNLIPSDLIDRLSQAAAVEDEVRDKSAESRMVIIKGQWEIFKSAPWGSGHRGTKQLSTKYIDEEYLTLDESGEAGRASHNLLMSLLVDFGLVGASLYLFIVFYYYKRLLSMRKQLLSLEHGNLSILYVAGVSALLALLVSSMFSNSLRLEISIQLFGMLTALFCIMRAQSIARAHVKTQF